MIILVYSSVSFNTRIDLCNHPHNQDTEQFCHPKSIVLYIHTLPSPLTTYRVGQEQMYSCSCGK